MNDMIYKRIIKLISIHYAIKEEILLNLYQELNSIDKILDLIKNKEVK